MRIGFILGSLGIVLALAMVNGPALCQTDPALFQDPPRSKTYPAAMHELTILSHGEKLNAILYTAAGSGTHPCVILLHGFPGNERNLDLAQVLRRAGWNVLFFSYRGSWGSSGAFSFSHCLEDADAVLAFVRDPLHAEQFRLDPGQIVLIGHSMGGFIGLGTAAHDHKLAGLVLISAWDPTLTFALRPIQEKDLPELARSLEPEMGPLAGCSGKGLADEILAHIQGWNFNTLAQTLGSCPTLVVTSADGLATVGIRLTTKIGQQKNPHVKRLHFDTDHSYSDCRIALEEAILSWAKGLHK